MPHLNIVAVIQAKPGKALDVENLLSTLSKETHKEPGCLVYSVHKSAHKEGYFMVVEKWASQQDLDAHLASPHIATALRIKDQLLDVFEINSLIPIRAGHPLKESY